MKIELRELSLKDGKDILEMIREIGPGENGYGNNGYDMKDEDFEGHLLKNMNISRGLNLKPDMVPQTKYWLIVDGRPVGVGKLRPNLNDKTRKIGGHIGYCIRPSERGKGYGNIILKELLNKALEKKIPHVLLTCDEANIASSRVMENNGGVLETIINGKCYYWINLTEGKGIREIHIDDYREIYELWSKTPGMGLTSADSFDNIQKFLSRNKNMSFCYEEDGIIVGTILCGHDGRRGYIYHVTVAEELRGRGIGQMLVNRSLERLNEEGIQKCHLFVFTDNEIGNTFWKLNGWTKREDIFVYSKNIIGGLSQ